jgi:hypothetical protein
MRFCFDLSDLGGYEVKQPLMWSQGIHGYDQHRTHHNLESESE